MKWRQFVFSHFSWFVTGVSASVRLVWFYCFSQKHTLLLVVFKLTTKWQGDIWKYPRTRNNKPMYLLEIKKYRLVFPVFYPTPCLNAYSILARKVFRNNCHVSYSFSKQLEERVVAVWKAWKSYMNPCVWSADKSSCICSQKLFSLQSSTYACCSFFQSLQPHNHIYCKYCVDLSYLC